MYNPDSFSYKNWLENSEKYPPYLNVSHFKTQSSEGLEVALLQSDYDQVFLPAFSSHIIVIHLDHIFGFRSEIERSTDNTEVREGEISIIPSGVSSTWEWEKKLGNSGCLHLALDIALLRQITDENEYIDASQIEILPHFLAQDLQIKHIGLALKAELEASAQPDSLFIESLTTALAMRFLKRFSSLKQKVPELEYGLSKKKLSTVIDYISNNLDEDLKLANIAASIGIGTSHFTRLFKQSMGITPYQYIIQCRVYRARLLLLQKNLTISEVADQVNFYDQSHLTYHFKKILGVTPKNFCRNKC